MIKKILIRLFFGKAAKGEKLLNPTFKTTYPTIKDQNYNEWIDNIFTNELKYKNHVR